MKFSDALNRLIENSSKYLEDIELQNKYDDVR